MSLLMNFTPFPVLETERLVLRELKEEDEETLYAIRLATRPRTREEIRELVQKIKTDTAANNMISWTICLRGDDRMIGDISFWRVLKEHSRAEIGYSILPEFHRKGIATEALRAVLAYGFETMNLHSVEANTAPENAASRRLLEKHGFVQEGYFRENYFVNGVYADSAIYSLLKKNYAI